jgi:hypothetical protein
MSGLPAQHRGGEGGIADGAGEKQEEPLGGGGKGYAAIVLAFIYFSISTNCHSLLIS